MRSTTWRMNGSFAPEAAAWARTKVKTVLTRWPSARYRAARRAGWRRNCHVYAAIGIPGMPRKFGGPDFARGAFQFGDNFINDRITDLRQFGRATRLDRVSDRQHLQGEHV
jgi:hypothetical protein